MMRTKMQKERRMMKEMRMMKTTRTTRKKTIGNAMNSGREKLLFATKLLLKVLCHAL